VAACTGRKTAWFRARVPARSRSFCTVA
jgi:hypothetical protein